MWTATFTLLLLAVVHMLTFQVDAINKSVALFPRDYPVVLNDSNLYLNIIEPIPNMEHCTLNLLGNVEMVLLKNGMENDASIADFQYWGKGLSSGECGVLAHHIQPTSTGKWTLSATNSTGTFSGETTVTVYSDMEVVFVGDSLIPGESGTVQLNPSDEIMYCYLRHPSGHEFIVQNKACSNVISTVTNNDAGEWSALYAVKGNMMERRTKATYALREELTETQLVIEKMESGALNLLCRLHNFDHTYEAKFCRFIRPDGTGMYVSDGIGDDHYSYFGTGLDGNPGNKKMKDCGIVIHSPKEEDYGTWKCIIHLYSVNEKLIMKGGFLKVDRPGIKSATLVTVHSETPQIVALNNSVVKLLCKANASIKGCWFRHPSGFNLHPSSSVAALTQYTGAGLELGECGISLHLYNEDSGNWTCNVALEGEADRQVIISVSITEKNIIPDEVQGPVSTGKEAKMLFRMTVGPLPIHYCHWIRPDGLGLTFITSDRNQKIADSYTYHGAGLEKGECGLKISSVHDVDFGNWTCTVFLNNDISKAELELLQTSDGGIQAGAIGGIVAAVLVLGSVAVGALVYWKFFRVTRRTSNTSVNQELTANENL